MSGNAPLAKGKCPTSSATSTAARDEQRTAPLTEEHLLRDLGYRRIAGIDEAGRGSWAGPVVAAVVVLSLDTPDLMQALAGVRDSKLLTAFARERLFDVITRRAAAYAVSAVPADEVDRLNVLQATRVAMRTCLRELNHTPDCILLDAVRLDGTETPQWSLVGGDRRSLSIAAASILAKVSRDRLMVAEQQRFPQFSFGAHKGYGTALHQEELRLAGPCEIHRRSFAPIRRIVSGLGI
jgi:ribonuclease HII